MRNVVLSVELAGILLFSSTKQHKSDPNSFSAGAEDAC
jgi:hypothetical protein